MPCFTGRRNRLPHARNTAFRISHCAFFFAPSAGRQQQIGIVRGFGVAESLLHHHEFRHIQRLLDQIEIGHGLHRIGAGDPDGLDFAASYGLEHFHGSLARRSRNIRYPPQCGDFGAVHRIGQITMAGQYTGHAADFAPTHSIRLAGERERGGTRLADLAGGEVQVDQRGIFLRAMH